MKQITFLVLIITCLSCNEKITINDQEKVEESEISLNDENIEIFGNEIFSLIKAKDLDSILSFYPKYEEYEELMESSDYPVPNKISRKQNYANNYEKYRKGLISGYENIMNKFDKDSIDLSRANLNYIDFKHTKRNKVETATLYLKFNIDHKNYKIEISNCKLINSEWKVGSTMKFRNYRDLITGV